MRLQIITTLLFLTNVLHAQNPVFNWGKADRKPFPETEVRILGASKDGYYVTQKKGPGAGEFSPTVEVDHYTANHVRDLSTVISPDNRYDFVDVVVFNGKAWLLAALFEKTAGKNRLMAMPVTASGASGGDEIASIPAEKLAARGSFKAGVSADGSKLVILAQPAFKKEMKEPGTITIFDGSFDKPVSVALEFSNQWTRDISNSLLVNNAGTAFIVKRSEPKGYTAFTVATWKAGTLKEFPLELDPNQKFSSIVHNFTADGDLLTGAYFTEQAKIDFVYGSPSNGNAIQQISADGAKQKFYLAQPFRKRDAVIVRNIIATNDRYLLLGEQYQREDIGPKKDDAGNFIPFEREYSYYGDEVIVDGFDKTGKPLYTQLINKQKYTVGDNGILHGYVSGIVGNELVILFNDYLSKHDGKKKFLRFGIDYFVPALARVDIATGKMEAATGLLDTGSVGGKNGDMPLRPAVFLQVGDRSFILRGENRLIYKMGSVSF